MSTTMIDNDNIDNYEFDPDITFWGGPLDGVTRPWPMKVPNRELKLFTTPQQGVLMHDPEGANVLYFYCGFHARMEQAHTQDDPRKLFMHTEEDDD